MGKSKVDINIECDLFIFWLFNNLMVFFGLGGLVEI